MKRNILPLLAVIATVALLLTAASAVPALEYAAVSAAPANTQTTGGIGDVITLWTAMSACFGVYLLIGARKKVK